MTSFDVFFFNTNQRSAPQKAHRVPVAQLHIRKCRPFKAHIKMHTRNMVVSRVGKQHHNALEKDHHIQSI